MKRIRKPVGLGGLAAVISRANPRLRNESAVVLAIALALRPESIAARLPDPGRLG
jgi:hypothetical protein